MARVELDTLRKDYHDTTAVDEIDLQVDDGEFLVLVGPSGCGKSTTLRTISGLEQPTSGEIRVDDRPVTDLPPEDRNVSMVFQSYALYPHMTARRNITFGMTDAGDYTKAEIERRLTDVAATLEIGDLLDRKPRELSGGEKQRVALGRSLVRDPDILLMDEPLSNLDAKLRVQMRAELAQLHDEFETTTVYVTHDQVEAMTLGDRVAVMNEGHIEQVDPPQDLYERPEGRFVAEFIGSPPMNLIPVTLRTRDGVVTAVWDDQRLRIPGFDQPGVDGTRATLGVRPETLTLADRDEPFTLQCIVSVTESLGENLLVHGRTGDTSIRVRLPPRADVSKGGEYHFRCDPDRLHLFDADSGAIVYQSRQESSVNAPSVPQSED